MGRVVIGYFYFGVLFVSVWYIYFVCIVSVLVMQNMLIKSLGRSQGLCSFGPFAVITQPPMSRPQDKGDILADALQNCSKPCSNRTAEGMQWHFFHVASNFNIFEEQNAEEEQVLSLLTWNSA